MIKISDKTDYSRFARPADEDKGVWLDHVVHLVTHPVGQVNEMPLEAGPADVVVTPAGTAHSYEVLGDEPAPVACVDTPVRPGPEA